MSSLFPFPFNVGAASFHVFYSCHCVSFVVRPVPPASLSTCALLYNMFSLAIRLLSNSLITIWPCGFCVSVSLLLLLFFCFHRAQSLKNWTPIYCIDYWRKTNKQNTSDVFVWLELADISNGTYIYIINWSPWKQKPPIRQVSTSSTTHVDGLLKGDRGMTSAGVLRGGVVWRGGLEEADSKRTSVQLSQRRPSWPVAAPRRRHSTARCWCNCIRFVSCRSSRKRANCICIYLFIYLFIYLSFVAVATVADGTLGAGESAFVWIVSNKSKSGESYFTDFLPEYKRNMISGVAGKIKQQQKKFPKIKSNQMKTSSCINQYLAPKFSTRWWLKQ